MDSTDYLASLDAEMQSLLADGRVYDAICRLDNAMGVLPRTPGDLLAAGTALLLLRDMEGALRHFSDVVAKHFAYDHARCGRALALRGSGRAAEAESELKRAVQLAEERRRSLADAPDGPIYDLYMKHEKIIRWAHVPDVVLYRLALGDAAEAERIVREALPRAAAPILTLLQSRLGDYCAIAPDNARARSLLALLAKSAGTDPQPRKKGFLRGLLP